jgi:hypothetical protein
MAYRWVILPSKIPPNNVEPIKPTDIAKIFTDIGGFREYWLDVTLGKVDMAGALYFDKWVTPAGFDRAGYAGGATPDRRRRLATSLIDAARLAGAAIDDYDCAVLYTNEMFDAFGTEASDEYPGYAFIGHGASQCVIAHEMGHAMGMNHTYGGFSPPTLWLDGSNFGKSPRTTTPNLMAAFEYGDRSDILSAQAVWKNKDRGGPGLCGPHLLDLDAIPAQRIFDVQEGAGPVVIQLAPLLQQQPMLPSLIRARLQRSASGINGPERPGAYCYFVEFRIKTGWDEGFPNSGLVVHELRPISNDQSANPDKRLAARVVRLCRQGRGLTDPPLREGERFLDPERAIAVSALSIDSAAKVATVEVQSGYKWSFAERFRAVQMWASKHGYPGGLPNFHQANYGRRFGTILLPAGDAEWRDIPVAELNNAASFDARFRAVSDWAAAHGYVGGYPNFHEANYGHGKVYGTVLFRHAAADWADVPVADLKDRDDDPDPNATERIRLVSNWAWRHGYLGGFPNFHEADRSVLPALLISSEMADWRDIPAVQLGQATTPEARFRAVNDWAAAHGYISGFPNFFEAHYEDEFGTILLKAGAADWRDIPASELGNPTSPEARVRAVNDWASARGYVGAFPNFHQADYGHGLVYGVLLIKRQAGDWRDIPAAELNYPADFAARFRAVNDWAAAHGYLSGFPNFHEANYGQGVVYGAVLLKRETADWRDLRGSELGNPSGSEARFRAVNDWANGHGYVSGYPNFHQIGAGLRYGAILLKQGAGEWQDVPAVSLGNPTGFMERIAAAMAFAKKGVVPRFLARHRGGFPNFHGADYGSGLVYGIVTFNEDMVEVANILSRDVGDPVAPEAVFRAVNQWAASRGYVGAIPTFEPGKRIVYGSILVKKAAAAWRDIPSHELGEPDTPEARFRAVNDWAAAHGYVSGFPNFNEADYGTEYGTLLLRTGAAEWRDIPASDLNHPSTPEARFREVNTWAGRNGFVGGYPNFNEATYDGVFVYGVFLFRADAADWRDIPVAELNMPDSPEARMRAVNDWASAHGYVSGFPTFHEADYGAGKVYGAVLLKQTAAEWKDIPGSELLHL